MTRPEPFSVARMRGSLRWFAAGKLVSGVVGVLWLLMLVRVLSISEYGGYIVLVALLEVVLAVSNGGVYAFAQRYVTEARLAENLAHLGPLVWRSVVYRLATLLLTAFAIAWFASPLAALVRAPALATVLTVYACVVVFEGMARYLELVFESMLDQGKAQLCAVFRNGMRLLIVMVLWFNDVSMNLSWVVAIEVATSAAGALLALFLLYLTLKGVHPGDAKPTAHSGFSLGRIAAFVTPMQLALCINLIYHPDTIKLVISRLMGVVEAASFGFAHAISNVLLRYLPASLLLGLIRPMLVARRNRKGSDEQLIVVGNLVLKINLVLLTPVVSLVAVCGFEVMSFASGGRFGSAWPLLLSLTMLLVLMGLHVVLSMLATAIEDRRAVLLGTIVSVPGVLVGIALSNWLGALAMVIGLWVSEILYCCFTAVLLRRANLPFRIDWAGWGRIGAAGLLATAVAAGFLELSAAVAPSVRLALAAACIGVVYLAATIAVRPFSKVELSMVWQLLPVALRRRVKVA